MALQNALGDLALDATLQSANAKLDAILAELNQKLEAGQAVALDSATLSALESISATISNFPSDYPDSGALSRLNDIYNILSSAIPVVNISPIEVSNFPEIQVTATVLPQVTATVDSVVPDDFRDEDFLKVGGFNDDLKYKVLRFSGDNLKVTDSDVLNSINFLSSKIKDPIFISRTQVTPAINSEILTGTISTTAWYDTQGYYYYGSISIIGTVANGTIILEGTNDNTSTTGTSIPLKSGATLTAGPIITSQAISTTTQNLDFTIKYRYIRIRFAVASTGIVNSRILLFPQNLDSNHVMVTNALTAAITSGTVTTVSSVTSSNNGIPSTVTDVASSAITTNTTTATLTPTFGSSYRATINVTAVSGINQTMDVTIQESDDGGTVWEAVYKFSRITAVGIYRSPLLNLRGSKIRYVQEINGTTPSFTRSIFRLQSSSVTQNNVTQWVDRVIDPNTLNSTSLTLNVRDAKNLQIQLALGAVSSAPTIKMQGSDDGVLWYDLGTVTGLANSTVNLVVQNNNTQLIRGITSSAGSGSTLNYLLLKGF